MDDNYPLRASGKLDANVPKPKVLEDARYPPELIVYDPHQTELEAAAAAKAGDLNLSALLSEPAAETDAETKAFLRSTNMQQTSLKFKPKPHWVLDEEYMDLHISADRKTVRLQRPVRNGLLETVETVDETLPAPSVEDHTAKAEAQPRVDANADANTDANTDANADVNGDVNQDAESAPIVGASSSAPSTHTSASISTSAPAPAPAALIAKARAELLISEELVGPTPLHKFVGQIWGQPGFLTGVHVWHARVNEIVTRLILGVIQKPIPKGHNSTLCSYGYGHNGYFYNNNEMVSGREQSRLSLRYAKGDVLTFALDLERGMFSVFHRQTGFAHSQKIFPNGHHFYVYAFLEGAGTSVTFIQPTVVEEKKGLLGIFS
eukprot:TRINITY_DN8330_c0_g2_i1.p1 TRINITY_DN8330_c0_g2~~TRINITY_DN8330_c0_g2_i1.p1  ORF type:complete len:378 (+),score=84.86 TRINITY_DN8330_c0_g2_i1:93-1226(+)